MDIRSINAILKGASELESADPGSASQAKGFIDGYQGKDLFCLYGTDFDYRKGYDVGYAIRLTLSKGQRDRMPWEPDRA